MEKKIIYFFLSRYRIVKGDAAGNFSVDSVTGEIRPNGLIDYELIESKFNPGETQRDFEEEDSRMFQLTLRAYDLGNPPLFSDVPVVIFVTDKNDHAPQFEKSHYRIAIDEDTEGGSEILQVRQRKKPQTLDLPV